MKKPEEFDGDITKARNFIHSCQMYFRARPSSFTTDDAKIRFADSLMTDKNAKHKVGPRSWAIAKERCYDATRWPLWTEHHDAFLETYKEPDPKNAALSRLQSITQGHDQSISEFAVILDELITCAEINLASPMENNFMVQQCMRAFKNNLAEKLIEKLPANATYEDWIREAAGLERGREMLKGVRQRQGVVHTPRPQKEAKDPDAMDVDAVQLR